MVWFSITRTGIECFYSTSVYWTCLVLVDKENNYRVGRCSFNVKENPASPTDSDWHHISYINQLSDTSLSLNLMVLFLLTLLKRTLSVVLIN